MDLHLLVYAALFWLLQIVSLYARAHTHTIKMPFILYSFSVGISVVYGNTASWFGPYIVSNTHPARQLLLHTHHMSQSRAHSENKVIYMLFWMLMMRPEETMGLLGNFALQQATTWQAYQLVFFLWFMGFATY